MLAARRGYLVVPTGSGLRGILLTAPQSRVTRTAPCLLCQTVHPDNGALSVAKRPRGNGSSVGNLVASAFGFRTRVTG